jgi:hypothetical protein
MPPKVRTPLDTDSVTEYEMRSFRIMTEAYLNRGNTRITCTWVSGTDPTTKDTTDSSDHWAVSPTKRTSYEESKP